MVPCINAKSKVLDSGMQGPGGTSIRYLPECLLIEILCRVPVESVVRFKCVSKRWLSLISGQSFVKYYCESRSPPNPWALLDAAVMPIVNGDGTSTSFVIQVLRNLTTCPQMDFGIKNISSIVFRWKNDLVDSVHENDVLKYHIAGVSNGLLLCRQHIMLGNYRELFRCYFILNPVTRQCVRLPMSCAQAKSDFPLLGEGLVARVEDGLTTSYKVVRVLLKNFRDSLFHLDVFSSETDDWEIFKIRPPKPIRIDGYCKPAALNGILHWYDKAKECIFAYDPYGNSDGCRLISFPEPVSFCDVAQGYLRCISCKTDYIPNNDIGSRWRVHLKVWTLVDYDAGKWVLEHEVTLQNMLTGNWVLIAFHPLDWNIVYFGPQMSSLDFRTNKVTRKKIGDTYSISFPFLLQPWPTAIPQRRCDH